MAPASLSPLAGSGGGVRGRLARPSSMHRTEFPLTAARQLNGQFIGYSPEEKRNAPSLGAGNLHGAFALGARGAAVSGVVEAPCAGRLRRLGVAGRLVHRRLQEEDLGSSAERVFGKWQPGVAEVRDLCSPRQAAWHHSSDGHWWLRSRRGP